MGIHWADLVILAIIGISALISLLRGFLREVLSLLAWVLAFWVALSFTPLVAPWLAAYVEVPSVRLILAFAALFVVTLLSVSLIGHIIVKLVGKTGLTGTDRTLGLLFGMVRGGLVVLLLVLLAGLTQIPQDPWWRQASLLAHFQRGALWVKGYLPENIAEYIRYDLTAPPATPDETEVS